MKKNCLRIMMNYTSKQQRYFFILCILFIYVLMRYGCNLSSSYDEYFLYITLLLLWYYHYNSRSYMMTLERLEDFHRDSELEYRYHLDTVGGILDYYYVRVKGYDRLWYKMDVLMTCGVGCCVKEFESYCLGHVTVGSMIDGMRSRYANNPYIHDEHDLDLYDYNTARWFSLFWLLFFIGLVILVLHRNELGIGFGSSYDYYYY